MIAIDLRFYDGHYDGGVYKIVRSLILAFNKNNIFLTVAVRSHQIKLKLISSGLSCSNLYIIKPFKISYLFDTFLFGHYLFPDKINTIFWPYNTLPFFIQSCSIISWVYGT